MSRRGEKGFSVLGVLITIAFLASVGSGAAYFVASSQSTRIQQVQGDQAFYATHAGMEFALAQINSGNQSTSMTRHFSNEVVTVTRAGGTITVAGAEGGGADSHNITDPNPPSGAGCLNVNTSGATMSTNTKLGGIVLSRAAGCTNSITILGVTVNWQPDNSERLSEIQIEGNPKEFTGSTSSGGTSDFGSNDFTINDGNSHGLTHLQWDTNVTDHNFTLTFLIDENGNGTYEGGTDSTKTVNVNFLANNQANCFQWNTGSGQLDWAGNQWKRLINTTVQNTCSQPIRLDKMTVSWTPTSPSRTFQQFTLASPNEAVYNGSRNSGQQADVDTTIAATTTRDVTFFEFDNEMLGRNYSLVWEFADATTKTTAFNLFNSNQHNCLTINTSNISIGGSGNKQFLGVTAQNTCAADIGIAAVTVSWNGGVSGQEFTRIKIIDDTNDVNYNGNRTSGQQADFGDTDVYMRDGVGPLELSFSQFDKSIDLGVVYTHLFEMVDGNTKSINFAVAAQSTALSINTSNAEIAGSGDVDLVGINVQNTGGSAITWDKVTVNWSGSGRKMQEISVDGSQVWSGNKNPNQSVNITDVTLSAGQTKAITFIRFNGDMSGRSFDITFEMTDGSTTSTPSFSPPDQ